MSMLDGVITADLGDRQLTLCLDNAAWLLVEEQLNQSMFEVLAELGDALREFRSVKVGTMRALLWAATRRAHEELTPDDCQNLCFSHPMVMGHVVRAVEASIKLQAPSEDAAPGEAAPGKRPATTTRRAGTGKTSSATITKRAAARPRSGTKRPRQR